MQAGRQTLSAQLRLKGGHRSRPSIAVSNLTFRSLMWLLKP